MVRPSGSNADIGTENTSSRLAYRNSEISFVSDRFTDVDRGDRNRQAHRSGGGPNSRGRFSGERVASMSAATCGIGGATKPGCRFAHPGCASFVFDLQMCNRHDLKSCGATLFAAACLRERAHIRKNAA